MELSIQGVSFSNVQQTMNFSKCPNSRTYGEPALKIRSDGTIEAIKEKGPLQVSVEQMSCFYNWMLGTSTPLVFSESLNTNLQNVSLKYGFDFQKGMPSKEGDILLIRVTDNSSSKIVKFMKALKKKGFTPVYYPSGIWKAPALKEKMVTDRLKKEFIGNVLEGQSEKQPVVSFPFLPRNYEKTEAHECYASLQQEMNTFIRDNYGNINCDSFGQRDSLQDRLQEKINEKTSILIKKLVAPFNKSIQKARGEGKSFNPVIHIVVVNESDLGNTKTSFLSTIASGTLTYDSTEDSSPIDVEYPNINKGKDICLPSLIDGNTLSEDVPETLKGQYDKGYEAMIGFSKNKCN
jgi:hypothetical protein